MRGLAAYVVVYTSMRRIEVDERVRSGDWQTQTFDAGMASIDGRDIALERMYARSSIPTNV